MIVCLFYGAVYTPALQGYIQVDSASQLTSYDSLLCFGLTGNFAIWCGLCYM